MRTQTVTNTEDKVFDKINQMSRVEMAHAWRFTPAGSPLFSGKAGEYFEQRFRELGGFSTDISKQIDW